MDKPVNLWKPEYLLDIEGIDAQHKVFFDICLDISQGIEADKAQAAKMHDIIKMLYTLRAYAFQHFHTEEQLLLKHHYPQIYAHLNLHDNYLRALQGFTKELHTHMSSASEDAAKPFFELALAISAFSADWWGEHILTADTAYAQHIRSRKGKA